MRVCILYIHMHVCAQCTKYTTMLCMQDETARQDGRDLCWTDSPKTAIVHEFIIIHTIYIYSTTKFYTGPIQRNIVLYGCIPRSCTYIVCTSCLTTTLIACTHTHIYIYIYVIYTLYCNITLQHNISLLTSIYSHAKHIMYTLHAHINIHAYTIG